MEEILGKRPFDHRTTYDEYVNGPADESDQRKAAEGLVHEGIQDNSDTLSGKPNAESDQAEPKQAE